MNKIYVCEWSTPDLELKDSMFILFQTYDYTYHYEIEQCKILANMSKQGYIICKSMDPNDENTTSIHHKIQCLCIWTYENGEIIGKYDWNDSHWIYSSKSESWDEDWKDMISLPVPLKEF